MKFEFETEEMFEMDELHEIATMVSSRSVTTATNNDRLKQSSCEKIRELYDIYDNDLYMTSKIHHYISQQLPTLLENIKETRLKSIQRNMDHSHEQDRFVSSFLGQYRYYYHSTNECYFYYDGCHYSEMREDAILHHIVSSISEDRNPMLMNWKHKTKVSILKKIKDRSIMKTIPDSVTIQTIIQKLQPYVCESKAQSKYLLTILGDNILKKHSNKIHYIDPCLKDFLKAINSYCMDKFNLQCTQTFKYKFHEKHYETLEECRMIPSTRITNYTNDLWYEGFFSQYGLDLLCVAVHYSNKYGSSDDFVENTDDMDMRLYCFSLKNRSPVEILKQFSQEYLVDYEDTANLVASYSPQEEYFLQRHLQSNLREERYSEQLESFGGETSIIKTQQLTWTEIQYLWKDFLKNHHYPLNLFSHIYKTCFIEQCFSQKYDEASDSFRGLGSSQMPLIQKFLKFWDETIIEDTQAYAELEIEEISQLFRYWCTRNTNPKKKDRYLVLKESQLLDILSYFHPELEIGDQKYVYHVRNLLWDKDMDIENALAHMEQGSSDSNLTLLEHTYSHYMKFYTHNRSYTQKPFLVSKSYFTKYVSQRNNEQEFLQN